MRDLGDRVRAEALDGRLKATRQEASLRPARPHRPVHRRRPRHPLGQPPVRREHRAPGPHPGPGRRRPRLRAHRHRLPLTGRGPGLRRHPPVLGPAAALRIAQVYRAEHLAARLLDERGPAALAEADLPDLVRQAAETAYDEGHERGVHDHDATAILTAVLRLHERAGLLRHEPAARAAAQLFWAHTLPAEECATLKRRAMSLARARDTFGLTPAIADFRAELAVHVGQASAVYLFEELTTDPDGFVVSTATRTLLDTFRRTVGTSAYDEDLTALDDLAARRQLVEAWLSSYSTATGTDITPGDLAEAVAAELCPDLPRYESDAPLTGTVTGLLGTHPRITDRSLTVRVDEFLSRTREFRRRTPRPSAPTSGSAPPS